MIYEVYKDYTSRKATVADLPRIYEVLLPFVTSETLHKNMNELNIRQMKSLVKYYTEKYDSLLIEDSSKNIVSVYVGEGNNIGYIANIGDTYTLAMLFKTVLCDIHNKFTESKFTATTPEQKNRYLNINRISHTSAVVIDGYGNGTIPIETKNDVVFMYEKLIKE